VTVDLTSIANILLSLAAAAVAAAIPIVVPAVLKRFGQANNADLTANLELALQAAAGGAYKYAASHEGGLSNVAVHNGALAQATTYIVSNLPDTLKELGITPDKVQEMVSKRLGALLATDPTVTAGKPPAAVPAGAGPAPVVQGPPPAPPPLRPVPPAGPPNAA
jgi:hypothetical protein